MYLFIELLPLALNVSLAVYAVSVFKQIAVDTEANQLQLDQMSSDLEVERLRLVSEGVL